MQLVHQTTTQQSQFLTQLWQLLLTLYTLHTQFLMKATAEQLAQLVQQQLTTLQQASNLQLQQEPATHSKHGKFQQLLETGLQMQHLLQLKQLEQANTEM